MTQQVYLYLEFLGRFMNACVIYIVVQLGRAVQISIVMLAVILLLRGTILRRKVFGKGILWSLLLLAPFMGKLTLYYETKVGAKLFFWWQSICGEFHWIPWLYVTGMLGTGVCILYKQRTLKHYVKYMELTEICGTQVYVSELAVSPFTVGVVHPRIVIPEVMLENLKKEELYLILLHEKVHIRMGHLWCYLLWDVLRILLWLNPLLAVCMKYFRSDLEDTCDRITIQKGNQTAYSYGCLLLKSIRMLKAENQRLKPSVTFAGEKEYRNIKKRMKQVLEFKPYKQISVVCLIVGCGIILTTAFLGIKSISYPRYTSYENIQIYNQMGTEVLVSDSTELREAIQIDEGNVYIDRKALDNIFKERDIESDVFFIYFGGFSKLPGIGGGGNGVFVDYTGTKGDLVIPYVDEEKDIFIRLFKYL